MTLKTRIIALVLLCLVLLSVARADPQETIRWTATRVEAWDEVFRRQQGWTGADGACSIDLGDGRTLWTYGDTLVGRVEQSRHVSGSRLVNNSLAIHPTPASGGIPDRQTCRFFWGDMKNEQHPTAWISPTDEIRSRAGISKQSKHPSWFWLADGLLIPAEEGATRLVLFLWHIARTPEDRGVWSFQSVGGAIAVVENPHQPIGKWRVRQIANPHAISSPRGEDGSRRREVSWGSEVLLRPTTNSGVSDDVYIYGVREAGGWNKQLVLAKVSGVDIEDLAEWRFWQRKGWTRNVEQADALADHIVNEFSISPSTITDDPTWYFIHSEPFFGSHIMVRRASEPEGPWSEPEAVFLVDELERHESYFTYAAKGHADLSRRGELLISYVVNSHDFAAMVRDADIYRPRFVRLPLPRRTDAD